MNKIFVALYLSTCLVPILGSADMAMTQILFLQVTNIFSIIGLIYKEGFKPFVNNISQILKVPQLIFFSLFILWALLSTIKSVNLSESFRVISDLLTYLIALTMLISHLSKIQSKKTYVINFLLFILFLEVAAIILLFLLDISAGSFDFGSRISKYKGLTGNINIAAFSIAIKLPLLFYKIIKIKKWNWSFYILFFFSCFTIVYLHKTRAAILTIILIAFAFAFYNIFLWIRFSVYQKKHLILLLIFGAVFAINKPLNIVFKSNASTISRLATLGSDEDESSNERIRYYSQAFDTFLENPIFGVGIGNWELKSIETDSENIRGYIVPYHAHNDILELLAETGLLGAVLYFLILFSIVLFLIKRWFSDPEKNTFLFFIATSLLVYFCDAMFNFPFARPIQQMNFFAMVGLVIAMFYIDNSQNNYVNKPSIFKLQLFLLLFLSPAILYSASRVYIAYTQHYYLLGQFNANFYSQDIETVLKYEDVYPNLLPTTIPTNTIKGMFYLRKEQDYKSAIQYFKKGMMDNPYLKLSHTMLGYCYLMEDKIDSAIYYTKNAFDKMPNNPVHFTHYILTLSTKNDTTAIKEARSKVTRINDEIIDQIYLQTMANVLDKDNSKFVLNKLNRDLLNTDNDKLKGSVYILEYGKEMVLNAATLQLEGERLFKSKKYKQAAEKFEAAANLNPLEIPYHENAANAYMQAGLDDKALKIIDNLLDNYQNDNMKMLYAKALIMLGKEDYNKACYYLSIIEKSDFKISKAISQKYCKGIQ